MKIKFDDLPEGFEVRNGEIVEVKKTGGTTGDQKNYGLVTGPQDEYEHEEIKVKYSMSAVPRDEANIEAEGGETVLTDLNDDGNFGLYDIKGSRHANGGVPLYLPEQSFVFSDFNKMKLTKDEMKQMGVNSKKRLTPAKVSKKYGLNEYYASLKDPFADDIQAKSAELMLDKNKMQLSKLAFIQEAKKDFEEGVPVTAFPFLAETGYDPIEYTQQVEDITRQQAQQKYIESLPPEQQMQLQALQQYMAQVDEQEQEMIDANTEQGALPPPTNMAAQQGMMPPPPEMDNQQLAQMGFEVEDMSYAQGGTETKDKLTWEDIPGDYTDEEKKYLFDQAIGSYDVNKNIEAQRKWLKDNDWAKLYFQNSEEGERWRKNGLYHKKIKSRLPTLMNYYLSKGYDVDDIVDYLYDIAKRDDYNVIRSDEEIFKATGIRPEGYTPEKILKRILNSDDIYGEMQKIFSENNGDRGNYNNILDAISLFEDDENLKNQYSNKVNTEMLDSALDHIDLAYAYGNDLDEVERVNKKGRKDFNKNIEALKAKNNQKQEGNTSTSDQSSQTGNNQATKQEAQDFLADPDGINQTNTNVTTPSPKRNATATESKQSNFNFTNPNAVDPFATDSQFKPVVPGADKYQKNKDAYNLLEKTLTDVNDTEMQGIINESYNRFLENAKEQGLTNIPSKEELINEFLKYQKNNYNVRNLATEKDRFNPNLDKAGSIRKRKNQVASETFQKIAKENPEYEIYEIDEEKLKPAQLFFQTLWEVDSKKDNPRFGVEQLGPDQKTNWDRNRKISRVDGFYGNNTLNQFMFVANPKQQIEPDKEPENPVIKTKPQDEKINIQPNQLKVPYNPNDPRFWLQDLLKLNAIANRKRGKFYPWQPAVEDIEVDWVLEDPTRAIAAANEQMNIMAQGLGTFGGPQSFNARMSNIQGKNAANVANIIAGVHNRNINTTNRGLAQQAQFDYYIDKENRARNTKLYDDTMKVEQNALIEENFDREQYADALANAYTNMANTYNMNTLYDNYNIDPTTGGMVYFTNPTALDPSPYSAKSKMDKYFNFRNEFRSKFKYEPTETEIKYFMGIEDDDNQMSNYQREARAKGMGSGYNRGYDYTGQRGREINKLLPFFTGQVGI